MRVYNVYFCPKCEHYEYRRAEDFGRTKKGAGEHLCKVGSRPEDLLLTDDPLVKPPARCPDYELEARKRAK